MSIALGAQRADHRQAVALGQHAVDDQHVVVAVERQREAVLAVGRLVGDVADLAEGLDEVVRGVAVVFDDEQAHGVCWTRVAAKSSELSGLMAPSLSAAGMSLKKFGGGGGALHRPLFDRARLGGTGKAGARSNLM